MLTPVIDGHNDVLLRLWLKKNSSAAQDFVVGDGVGQMDLPRIKAGGMVGGFFAVFAPADPGYDPVDNNDDLNPLPAGGLAHGSALASATAMFDLRDAIVAEAKGEVMLCRTVMEMKAALAAGQLAWITHIEGAEAIATDLSNLEMFYERGLRSIGPVWSRPNLFGEGVPFRFPSSPDTGGGLTDAGRALIKRCNELRIMIDLSHITEKGFWDVARISNAPLIATHSNVHALSASSRNLTNEQLLAIGESGGMVGLNYATGFLREDGRWTKDTEPGVLIRHLEYMLKHAGENCVGLGSDFDGARIPGFISDVGGTPKLVDAMKQAGFDVDLIEKICWKNWLRVLEKTWGR